MIKSHQDDGVGKGGEMSVGKKSLRKADVRKAGGVLMHTKHNCAVLDFLNTLLLLSNSCGCRLDTLVQTEESTLAIKHTIERLLECWRSNGHSKSEDDF